MSERNREWIKHARIIELTHGATDSIDEFKFHLEHLRPDAAHYWQRLEGTPGNTTRKKRNKS